MTTHHSINQILYFGTGVAEPVSEGTGFSMNTSTQLADDTSWGDVFQTQKPGVIQGAGQINKHYSGAEVALHEAAMERKVGNFYWYPDRNDATHYWYWTGYVSGGGPQAGSLNQIIGQTYDLPFATQPVRVTP